MQDVHKALKRAYQTFEEQVCMYEYVAVGR